MSHNILLRIIPLCIWLINPCIVAFAQKNAIRNTDIVIPIITYTPIHFYETVIASFEYNKLRPCILKRKENNEISFYWYTNYTNKNKHFNLHKFEHFNNDSVWGNIVNANDSTFVFFPTISCSSVLGDCIPQNAPYYGYIKNGNLFFYNTKKHDIYSSFEKLVLNDYGSYRKFTESYLADVKYAMYNSYIENPYFIHMDKNMAMRLLKKDFAFYKLYATPDKDTIVLKMFLTFLKNNMVLTEYQKNKIQEIISQEKFNFENLSYLKKVFTIDEMKIFDNLLEDNTLLIKKCYNMLLKDFPNIAPDGHFYTDEEKRKIIYNLVFNN